MISVSDFIDWKSNPVTRAFFEAANIRLEDAKEQLSLQAGLDHANDNFLRGFIHAYREMQEFKIEDLEESSN